MKELILFTYQFSLFLLICYGAHAWFLWDFDFLDDIGLLRLFAILSLVAYVYQHTFKLKFKNIPLLLLIWLIFTIAESFPFFGFKTPVVSFFRIYPLFVLLNDTNHISDHLKFVTQALCIIIVPGLIIWALLFFVSFPGYPIQWGDLSVNQSYYFLNYIFFLKSLFYDESIRFQSIFLEPGYFGSLVAFLLYANSYNLKKITTWVLLIGLLASFSLAGWIIALIGFIFNRYQRGLMIKNYLLLLCFLGLLYGFAVEYNNGDNAINELIVKRLETDNDRIIAGNNRFSKDTEIIYEQYLKNNELWFGHPEIELTASAGYKAYFIKTGIFSAIFFAFFYFLLVFYSNSKKYGFFFMLLVFFTFLQASYPDSFSWLIPFVLGITCYSRMELESRLYTHKARKDEPALQSI